jgi:hypothetical protein
MLEHHLHLDRILTESHRIRQLVACTREIVATTTNLLSKPAPDTFLGRDSQKLPTAEKANPG